MYQCHCTDNLSYVVDYEYSNTQTQPSIYFYCSNQGRGCSSICCSGAYVAETMACVIVSDRIKELKLKDSFGRKIDSINIKYEYKYHRRMIMKYMNNDIPSIISHLTASIRNNFSEHRKPQLRSFICDYANMTPERLSDRKDNVGKGDQELIFNSFVEMQSYEKFPEILSSSAHEKNYKTKAYSENIQLQLCDLFSFGRGSFEKLTKIQFSLELDFYNYAYDSYGNLIHRELFENIGMSCPNLQDLDISHGFFVPNSIFIHLVFQDSESSIRDQNINIVTDEERSYYDEDEVDLFICPEILYERMKEKEVSVCNVVKISELLKCVPSSSDSEGRREKLNNLCNTLKHLRIRSDSKLSDLDIMIPFLLKAFPKLVTLDGVENIALGLQQLKDFSNDNAIIQPTLVNRLTYHGTYYSRESDSWEERLKRHISHFHRWIYETGEEEIIKEAAEILHNIEEEEGVGSNEHLQHFISTVSDMCPKATRIFFSLRRQEERIMDTIWKPLKNLAHLTEIVIYGSCFDNISPLLREIPNLQNIRMEFDKGNEDYRIPCVDDVLSQCSKIRDVTWHERTWQRSTVSSERAINERLDLSAINLIAFLPNISKEGFFWIWANATKLSTLHLGYVTLASARDTYFLLMEDLDHQEMFYKSDIKRMFQSNPMRYMCDFNANMCVSNIETARYFVDMFRKHNERPLSINRLLIKIELMESELVPETIERVVQEMKRFGQFCKELKSKRPKSKVEYKFVRIGRVKNYIDWNGNFHPAGDWDLDTDTDSE